MKEKTLILIKIFIILVSFIVLAKSTCTLGPNCATCTETSICESCNSGYYLIIIFGYDNKCKSCGETENCTSCANSECSACKATYFLNFSSKDCELCQVLKIITFFFIYILKIKKIYK